MIPHFLNTIRPKKKKVREVNLRVMNHLHEIRAWNSASNISHVCMLLAHENKKNKIKDRKEIIEKSEESAISLYKNFKLYELITISHLCEYFVPMRRD